MFGFLCSYFTLEYNILCYINMPLRNLAGAGINEEK